MKYDLHYYDFEITVQIIPILYPGLHSLLPNFFRAGRKEKKGECGSTAVHLMLNMCRIK